MRWHCWTYHHFIEYVKLIWKCCALRLYIWQQLNAKNYIVRVYISQQKVTVVIIIYDFGYDK